MRIALLHYAAPPVVGGVESVLAAHAGLMAGAGHQVSVICGRGEAWRADVGVVSFPLVDSMHETILRIKAALNQGVVPAEFNGAQAALVTALQPHLAGCDVVIAHNVVSLHKNLPLTAALRTLTQPGASPITEPPGLILWHHDLAATTPRYRDELHDGHPWSLVSELWPWALQVTISAQRHDEIAALYGVEAARIHVVPNGVDAANFLSLDAQALALSQHLRLDEAAPLLLLPVRLTPRKNVELALRTLAHLREAMPDAALLVTGPMGPHNPANRAYFDRLLALRTELGLTAHAHFLAEELRGYAPDALVASLYRMADALIFPSREEGFGIPLLEAGLARLPVFCAEIPPLREIGGDDVTYFAPDAAPRAVADRIAARLAASLTWRLSVRTRRFAWPRIYAERIEPLLQIAAA